MAHGYFDINLEVVWDTVKSALPALKSQLDVLRAT
ncbi:HepT-like ribonuclease domain-containing protein [Rhodoferax potami]